MSRARKVWRLKPHDAAAIDGMARALRASPVLAQLLLNRGVVQSQSAERFLRAPISGLYEPELLGGMPQAVDRIMSAVASKRRICIYGDYDVDGVTGTAILLTLLRKLGAVVDFHIPHRIEEGYGLNAEAIRRLAQDGITQIITVDCGITSLLEAEEAKRLGLELIITDHHEPRPRLPAADVIVHPRISDGRAAYPFGGLSGAGVALKLAWALCKRVCGSAKVTPEYRELLLDSVVLAALGTVADVVPLQDENRILVRFGLDRLRKCPSLGLQAILRSAGLDAKTELVSMDIGFGLGPRLNAAGRLGSARVAVELLTCTAPPRAQDLARFLEEQNQTRQTLERRILAEACKLAEACNGEPALVLAGEDWHPGLIGIVAGRLADLYGRPALVISQRDGDMEPCQGSGRSIPGFKLHEALNLCTEDLLSHGGHAAAAGFRIAASAIDTFRQRFTAVARRQFGAELPQRRLLIDAEIPLHALTTNVVQSLSYLEPFGAENPQPLFLAGGLQVVGTPSKCGNGERHLRFQVRQEGKYLKAIGFGMADRAEELMSAGGQCCLVFTPRFNEWQGFRKLDLEVVDFQPGPTATLG